MKKALDHLWERFLNQGGIRTHETLAGLLQHQWSAINRSATCP